MTLPLFWKLYLEKYHEDPGKQSEAVVRKCSCSKKNHKFYRETPALQSLFDKINEFYETFSRAAFFKEYF